MDLLRECLHVEKGLCDLQLGRLLRGPSRRLGFLILLDCLAYLILDEEASKHRDGHYHPGSPPTTFVRAGPAGKLLSITCTAHRLNDREILAVRSFDALLSRSNVLPSC